MVDSLAQGLRCAYQGTEAKVGLLLAHGSNFVWMPFLLPSMTHIGIGH